MLCAVCQVKSKITDTHHHHQSQHFSLKLPLKILIVNNHHRRLLQTPATLVCKCKLQVPYACWNDNQHAHSDARTHTHTHTQKHKPFQSINININININKPEDKRKLPLKLPRSRLAKLAIPPSLLGEVLRLESLDSMEASLDRLESFERQASLDRLESLDMQASRERLESLDMQLLPSSLSLDKRASRGRELHLGDGEHGALREAGATSISASVCFSSVRSLGSRVQVMHFFSKQCLRQ